MTTQTPEPRKVGITHMAFYRGWLQGLPLRDMADAYLDTGIDLRLAKSTLGWIQAELRRAALRHGRHKEARLLRLRIADVRNAQPVQPAEIPSIDDFRDEFDPTSFYTFDELMVHYLERYPAAGDKRARKRAALMERQLSALKWIEDLLVTAPVPADPIEAWFDPNIAARLRRGGLATLADLTQRIGDRGYRWYRGIPQFGERRAKQLVAWLGYYAESVGKLPSYVTVKPAAVTAAMKRRPLVDLSPSGPALPSPAGEGVLPSVPAIVPLEAMLLPRSVAVPHDDHAAIRDGSRITATDDRAAIETWLNTKSGSAATFRAYRKEAERLVLWATIERRVTLAGMGVEDCVAYRDWLCSLGRVDDAAWPFNVRQDEWFAPRHTKRYSPAWRPFEGPLSPQSVRYALTVCRALFCWLARVRYLDFDPWPVVANPRALVDSAPDLELTRVLSRKDWGLLMEGVDAIEDDAVRVRAHLLMRLALVTGMRLSELADARYDRIYSKPIRDGFGVRWMLKVRGKGDKWRSVPLTDDVMRSLRESLRVHGLPDDPLAVPPDTRIIATLSGEAITESGLSQEIKRLFGVVRERLADAGRIDEGRVFERASAHWIRHTTGAFLGDSGAPPSQIQQLLGHASIATTTIYTGTGKDELYKTVKAVLSP